MQSTIPTTSAVLCFVDLSLTPQTQEVNQTRSTAVYNLAKQLIYPPHPPSPTKTPAASTDNASCKYPASVTTVAVLARTAVFKEKIMQPVGDLCERANYTDMTKLVLFFVTFVK